MIDAAKPTMLDKITSWKKDVNAIRAHTHGTVTNSGPGKRAHIKPRLIEPDEGGQILKRDANKTKYFKNKEKHEKIKAKIKKAKREERNQKRRHYNENTGKLKTQENIRKENEEAKKKQVSLQEQQILMLQKRKKRRT